MTQHTHRKMLLVRHDEQPWEEWRPGVQSRAWATAATGAQHVRISEQILNPQCEAPMHWHYFEENITVLAGEAEFWVGEDHCRVGPGCTVIVPIQTHHGFRSLGPEPLHIIAAMSWPFNEIHYLRGSAGEAWRIGEAFNGGKRRKVGTVQQGSDHPS